MQPKSPSVILVPFLLVLVLVLVLVLDDLDATAVGSRRQRGMRLFDHERLDAYNAAIEFTRHV